MTAMAQRNMQIRTLEYSRVAAKIMSMAGSYNIPCNTMAANDNGINRIAEKRMAMDGN
jgi:hypothetical protein